MITPIEGANDYCNSVAIQADGKIIIAGSSSFGSDEKFSIARYISTDGKQALEEKENIIESPKNSRFRIYSR
jgi:hypothetical protein